MGGGSRVRPAGVRAPLDACNPTAKLAVLFAVSCAVLVLFEPLPLLALYLLALAGVRGGAGVAWPMLLVAQVPFVAFGVGVVAVNALSRPGEPLVEGLPVRITVEGLSVGLALAIRGLLIGVMSIGFIATTAPRALMVSLVQHARLSPQFAYALLAGHRMLAGMPQQWSTIVAAHSVRAPLRRDGRSRFGVGDFSRCAFALLVSSIRSSERIALALESRGLGAGPRTIWRPVPLGARDALLGLIVLGPVSAVVAATVLR